MIDELPEEVQVPKLIAKIAKIIKIRGLTFYPRVFYRETPPSTYLRAHEDYHWCEQKVVGRWKWLGKYIVAAVKNFLNFTDGNPFEVEAIDFGSRVHAEWQTIHPLSDMVKQELRSHYLEALLEQFEEKYK